MNTEASTRAAKEFVYRPLQNTDIRVISISPSTNSGSVVSCRIVQAPLESLTYYALSYVWGESSHRSEIYLDNKPFKVTANLEAYLRIAAAEPSQHFPGMAEAPYLWVDAICIDQKNIKERNAQVQRMGSIYSHATQVNIWLGFGSPHIGAGLDRMQKLAQISRQYTKPEELVTGVKREPLGTLFRDTLNDKASKEWQGMFALFQSSWWTRTWVLQELALAKTAVFFYGDRAISFDDIYHTTVHISLMAVADVEEVFQLSKLLKEDEATFVRALYVVDARALFEHNYGDRYTSTRLQELLNRTERAKATDARDKVYGLLGIASDAQIGDINPRYDLSVREIYIDIVVWHLEQYQNLNILGQCFSTALTNVLDLPSWVPHWEPKDGQEDGPAPFEWKE